MDLESERKRCSALVVSFGFFLIVFPAREYAFTESEQIPNVKIPIVENELDGEVQ